MALMCAEICWPPEIRLRRHLMAAFPPSLTRSEEHTSELQSHLNLVCRLLLEKKKYQKIFKYYQALFCKYCWLKNVVNSRSNTTIARMKAILTYFLRYHSTPFTHRLRDRHHTH